MYSYYCSRRPVTLSKTSGITHFNSFTLTGLSTDLFYLSPSQFYYLSEENKCQLIKKKTSCMFTLCGYLKWRWENKRVTYILCSHIACCPQSHGRGIIFTKYLTHKMQESVVGYGPFSMEWLASNLRNPEKEKTMKKIAVKTIIK